MSVLTLIAALGLLAVLLPSRLLGLARLQAGWVMYLANVVMEFLEKRLPLDRWQVEAALLLIACGLLWIGSGIAWLALAVLAVQLALVVENLVRERRIVNAMYAVDEPVGLRGASTQSPGYPAPGLHPRLSLNLEGPFVARMPRYDLGVLAVGEPVRIALLVGNHSRVPMQVPAIVRIDVPEDWLAEGDAEAIVPALGPGQVERVEWWLQPGEAAAGLLSVSVRSARFERTLVIAHAGCRRVSHDDVASVEVSRYPGARRAAFAWRGDMDLYDTASFQSIEGLETALGLGARYALAQTMYVSTRLSFDREAAEEWADHYGVARGAEEIAAFIEWLCDKVTLRHSSPYPARADRPYVMELGNHGHLHYDTDTAGAPGNDWRAGARAGEGRYPWQGDDHSSFGDQRDNIREATRWGKELFGFTPRSWAKPGRGNDEFTPAAVEAAGCEVATGSDIRARDNVLRQPPPHHPGGTGLVELTARYPSDPRHVQHAAMLEFWMHRGHRLGIPVVMLVHQHMRQFDGPVCARITEHLLDQAVNGFNGDMYTDTVYGIGRYWLDALAPASRQLEIHHDGGGIHVSNGGERPLEAVPLDIRLNDGQRLTRLLDLAPGQTITVNLGEPASS